MTSKALAIIGSEKPKTEKVKAEKMKDKPEDKITLPVETLYVHSALLLAAESVAAVGDRNPMFKGVYLHRREKVARVVAADGSSRLFIGSFPVEGKMPTWLTSGVILSAEGLKKKTQIIMSMQESDMVKLSHTKGSGYIEMSDNSGDAVFKIARIPLTYYNYEKALGSDAFSLLDEDGNVRNREWEPVGVASKWLKGCAGIADILNKGLEKERRNKDFGMIVRAYSGSGSQGSPMVFDFDAWPGAILCISPLQMGDSKVAKETLQIMSPAVKLTLAALRAHATRQLAWAEAASTPEIKADHEKKAEGFLIRIAKILSDTSALPSIQTDYVSTPEPVIPVEPTPEPEAQPKVTEAVYAQNGFGWEPKDTVPVEPELEPEPEPEPQADPVANDDKPTVEEEEAAAEKPTVTRTKIARKKKAA
jgi:hypothetical protein